MTVDSEINEGERVGNFNKSDIDKFFMPKTIYGNSVFWYLPVEVSFHGNHCVIKVIDRQDYDNSPRLQPFYFF